VAMPIEKAMMSNKNPMNGNEKKKFKVLFITRLLIRNCVSEINKKVCISAD
jgi:hypothetical protein